jgi:hypothetical protein
MASCADCNARSRASSVDASTASAGSACRTPGALVSTWRVKASACRDSFVACSRNWRSCQSSHTYSASRPASNTAPLNAIERAGKAILGGRNAAW